MTYDEWFWVGMIGVFVFFITFILWLNIDAYVREDK